MRCLFGQSSNFTWHDLRRWLIRANSSQTTKSDHRAMNFNYQIAMGYLSGLCRQRRHAEWRIFCAFALWLLCFFSFVRSVQFVVVFIVLIYMLCSACSSFGGCVAKKNRVRHCEWICVCVRMCDGGMCVIWSWSVRCDDPQYVIVAFLFWFFFLYSPTLWYYRKTLWLMTFTLFLYR